MSREAMKLALEALMEATKIHALSCKCSVCRAVIITREALAEQPAQRETAAWTLLLTGENHGLVGKAGEKFLGAPEHYERVDVYTSPPAQRIWVGLTDEEWQDLSDRYGLIIWGTFKREIEAKLREKNT